MKKLCTYLTLFVLSLLCLAQPAVAEDYTFYFQKPDSWTRAVGMDQWDFGVTNGKQTAEHVSGNIYKGTISSASGKGSIQFVQRNDTDSDWDWEGDYIKVTGDDVVNGHLYVMTGSGPNASFTHSEYVPQPAQAYIAGRFIRDDTQWGLATDVKEMHWDADRKCYTWDAEYTGTVGRDEVKYMVSMKSGNAFWDGRYNPFTVPEITNDADRPTAANLTLGGSSDFVLPHDGLICFDPTLPALWVVVDESSIPKFEANTSYYIDLSDDNLKGWFKQNGNKLYVKYGSDDTKIYPTEVEEYVYKFTLPTAQASLKIGYINNNGAESNEYTITPSEGNNCHKVGAGFHTNNSSWYAYNEPEPFTPVEGQVYIKGRFDGWTIKSMQKKGDYWTYKVNVTGNGSETWGFIMSTNSGVNNTFEEEGKVISTLGSAENVPLVSSKPTDGKANVDRHHPGENNNFLISGVCTIYFDPVLGQVWYQEDADEPITGPIYIRGAFLVDSSNSSWGTAEPVQMTEKTPGTWSIEAPRGGAFMISTSKDGNDFWSTSHAFVPADGNDYKVNATHKAVKHGHESSKDFDLDAKGTIYFDANECTLWVEYGKEQNFFYFDHTGCEWGVGQLEAYYYYEGAWRQTGPAEVVDGVTSFRIEVAMGTQPTQVYFKKIGGQAEDVTPTFDFERQATYHYYNAPHADYYVVGTFIEAGDGVTVDPSDSRTWGVSKTPMSYDPLTGIYTFDAPQFGSFYITTWKEGDAGAWWEAKYCWIPRNAEGHTMVPTKKTTDTNIVPGRMNDMDFLVDGKCSIYFVPGENGGHIWSSEPTYAANRWELWGQFDEGGNWRAAKNRFTQSYADDTFYCTLTPNSESGLFGVHLVDTNGDQVGDHYFGTNGVTISETNPEIEVGYSNVANQGQNATFNLTKGKTYIVTFTIKRDVNGNYAGATLKLADYEAPEVVESWDDYDFDMYLRGMMMFGRWDQGDGTATRKMEKVASQPGLFVSTIETVYDTSYTSYRTNSDKSVTETEERYHFMFSKKQYGMDKTNDDFWGPNGCNSYQPVGGTARLNADGTPVPFVKESVVGLNYSFSQPCRIYVDMKNNLCWVELLQPMSDGMAYFSFLDKGGDKWKDNNEAKTKYYWWNSNSDRSCQMYLLNEDGTESNHTTVYFKSQELQYEAIAEDRARTSIGYSYYFEESKLPEAFLKDGKVMPNVWVRIKKGVSADENYTINRPYVPGAVYTQGPLDDVTYNHYGTVTTLGEPLVNLDIEIEKIPSRLVVTTDHPGAIMGRSTIYDYVNRFKTTVNIDSDSYPFLMQGVTQSAGGLDDNKFVAVEGSIVKFSKENDATLKYGTQSLTKHGTTGKGLIYGIDYVNAAKSDNLTVKVTYKSEGMEFSLSKVSTLVDELDETAELPNIRNAYNEDELDKEYPAGQVYYFISDKAWNDVVSGNYEGDHKSVDAAFYMPFRFRKEMRENRAAYIGFELVTDSRDIDYDNIPEENFNVAKGGRPLITELSNAPEQTIWTGNYEDGEPESKQVVHNVDTWHREAFEQNCLAIRLHHLVCNNGEGKLDLTNKSVSGKIVYRMIVPVATDVEFLAGEEINPQGVKARVSSHDDAPYSGSFSTSRRDDANFMLTREFSFNGNTNVPTGVESVGVEDAEAPVEFYNLQGIRMNQESLAPGIYIRRQGNKASKVYVR